MINQNCETRGPEYNPGYYGVFLRDPDGNNVEAVHHGGLNRWKQLSWPGGR